MNSMFCIRDIFRASFLRPAVTLMISLFVVACSSKIDGTSLENFQRSTTAIEQGMSAEQVKKFRSDIRKASAFVAQSENNTPDKAAQAFVGMVMNPNASVEKIALSLHGKSVSDIEKLAEQWDEFKKKNDVRQEKEVREKNIAQLKNSADGNYILFSRADALLSELGKIVVEKLWCAQGGSGQDKYSCNSVAGSIANNSNIEVKSLEYKQQVTLDNGRQIESHFNVAFNPPLQPGQRRSVSFESNSSPTYVSVDAKDPMTIKAFGFKSIFDLKSEKEGSEFSKQKALNSLKELGEDYKPTNACADKERAASDIGLKVICMEVPAWAKF